MIEFYSTDYESETPEYVGSWDDGDVIEDTDGFVADLFDSPLINDGQRYTERQVLERFSGPNLYAVKVPQDERARGLASTVPDGAKSIASPGDAPAGTTVVQGPKGGWYYVPVSKGERPAESTAHISHPGISDDAGSALNDVIDLIENPGTRQNFEVTGEVSRVVGRQIGNYVKLPTWRTDDQEGLRGQELADAAQALVRVDEAGILERLVDDTGDVAFVTQQFRNRKTYASFVYKFNQVNLSEDIDYRVFEKLYDEGHMVGQDMEWLILHELGHGLHHKNIEETERNHLIGTLGVGSTPADVRPSGEPIWDEEKVRRRLELVEDEVSSYGRANAAEFVAEVFSGLCLGATYSEEIMSMYEDEYGGPDGWRDYREQYGYDEDPKVTAKSQRDMQEGLSGYAELPDVLRDTALENVRNLTEYAELTDDGEDKSLAAAVPAGAKSIASPADAPAGTQVVQGPRGGWYYVPVSQDTGSPPDDSSDGTGDTSEVTVNVVTADAGTFAASVGEFIDADEDMGAFLTAHTPDELADHTVYMSEDAQAGVSVSPKGDIQNLFNNGAPSGTGRRLIELAIEAGGRTLDCYAGHLPPLYAKFGFRETGRMEFNTEFAPEGWNFERFGEPDVVFMAYDPEAEVNVSDTYYEGDEWDDAKDDSRLQVVSDQ